MSETSPGQHNTDQASALFGAVASAYARHRITYPEAFFAAFRSHLVSPDPLVWDCGCGSGQASLDLAAHGIRVIATDASATQLAAAPAHPRIHWRQARAEASGLEASSVDGVLVAAAVHWFAGEAFNAEVRRVAKPGAVLAWIGYLPLLLPQPRLQAVIDAFHHGTLAPGGQRSGAGWSRATPASTFQGRNGPSPPTLVIERHWTLAELLAHIGTWSAVTLSRQAGADPLPALAAELKPLWPDQGGAALPVRWPFMGRWGGVGTAGP
jgi:SAM-dependent methyltransferase